MKLSYDVIESGYGRSDFGLRFELRMKNSRLVSAREALGLTQKQAAEMIGIDQQNLCSYENLKHYPKSQTQKKICEFYRERGEFMMEEDVFPAELQENKALSKKHVRVVSIPAYELLSLGDVDENRLSVEPNYYLEDGENKRRALNDTIKNMITRREWKILSLYYDLEGSGEEKTLEEIGELFKLSRERVRQIKEKALRRLRHYPGSKLREFI